MHTINRNNYESWLMLYLDNELTAAERIAVEAFAAAHPDVQYQLDGLRETLLHPDKPANMPGLERLLMPETWNEEALTRQQEQLLLMADGELPAHERKKIESDLSTSPLLNKEWALLQKTIFPSEVPGEMPGKEMLYRRTSSRIIPLGRIIQFAAAASIIGFGWFFINRQQPVVTPDEQQIVLAPQQNADLPAETSNTTVVPATGSGTSTEGNVIDMEMVIQPKVTENQKGVRVKDQQYREKHRNASAQESLVAASETKPSIPPESDNSSLAAQLPPVKYVEIDGIDAVEPPTLIQPKVDVAQLVPQAQPMVNYQLIDPDEYDEDETISIAGARISKQRIRNVYRNITRPIARTFDKGNIDRVDAK